MSDDLVLIDLLDQFLREEIGIADFERAFMRTYKRSVIAAPPLKGPLERAFLAIESWDPAVGPGDETIHNASQATVLTQLKAVREEIRSLGL